MTIKAYHVETESDGSFVVVASPDQLIEISLRDHAPNARVTVAYELLAGAFSVKDSIFYQATPLILNK